ncbi:acyl dehydratase [Pseudomonas sp. GM78]|uniref:FAS1-like dehydratase domain-containing protein n=1 Tax=Pseudomonas sp. GM78 TaxID=1144337 RepID=UPI00027082AA|nr:MaoC family dehydratase N-terminal domain-containing protein [Pseudomonas sp. GM78]EJN23292.1 acyl dehydratase [Pseudomonas sp. GM78]
MDLAALAGHRFAQCQWSFEAERVSALNQAIGMPPYINLPPTLAYSADMDQGVVEQLFTLTGLEAHQLLHGEQHFHYHQPLRPGHVYRSSAHLSEVINKPRFSLLHKHTRLFATDGSLACEMLSIYVAVPKPGAPNAGPALETHDSPARIAPEISREQIQAFASASGDHNRVHLEPAIAQKAGHPDVFAQGMLGMGLLGSLLPGSRLRRFGVRFLSPIALGDHPRLYLSGGTRRNLILANENNRIRIRGYAELD